jgi:hypothetical protein
MKTIFAIGCEDGVKYYGMGTMLEAHAFCFRLGMTMGKRFTTIEIKSKDRMKELLITPGLLNLESENENFAFALIEIARNGANQTYFWGPPGLGARYYNYLTRHGGDDQYTIRNIAEDSEIREIVKNHTPAEMADLLCIIEDLEEEL